MRKLNCGPRLAASTGAALLFALGACQLPPIEIEPFGTVSAPLVGPFQLTASPDPATAARLRQRGLIAESAALRLTVAQSTRDAGVGVCTTAPLACPAKPRHRWFVSTPPTRHTLTLSFVDSATGALVYRVEAHVLAKPALGPERTEQLLNAALACTGCTNGRAILAR